MSNKHNSIDHQIVVDDQHDWVSSQIVHKILMVQQKSITSKENQNQSNTSNCQNKLTYLRKFVQNIYFQIGITLLTIISLFIQDIRVIGINSKYDNIVDGINIMFILLFTIQVLLNLTIPGYVCSFFFYLDILSTASILMDINMLTNHMYVNDLANQSQLALSILIRNSKATRAAVRVVRIIKVFRLARIIKVYKSTIKTREIKLAKKREQIRKKLNELKEKKIKKIQKDLQNKSSFKNISQDYQNKYQSNHYYQQYYQNIKGIYNSNDGHGNINYGQYHGEISSNNKQISSGFKFTQSNCPLQESTNKQDISSETSQIYQISQSQSNISRILSESTMKKIIILILLIMLSTSILQSDNFINDSNGWDFLCEFVANMLLNQTISIDKINQIIADNVKQIKSSSSSYQQLVIFETPFNEIYSFDSGNSDELRVSDIILSQINIDTNIIIKNRNNTITKGQVDKKIQADKITIIISCHKFNQIDSMFSIAKIGFICGMIIYLLHVFNFNVDVLVTQPIEKMLEDVKGQCEDGEFQVSTEFGTQKKINPVMNNYETQRVNQTLNKISQLIQKIFGLKGKQQIYKKLFEKGTVISKYLSENKKIYCIVGLCTIQNYHVLSRILKGHILELNNQIAHYLHSAVYRYGGSGVMNYQDSFLVIFQCPQNYEYLVLQDPYKRKSQIKQIQIGEQKNNQGIILQKNKKKILGDIKFITLQDNKIKIGDKKYSQIEENNYLNIFTDFTIYSLIKTIVKINKQSRFFKYKKLLSLVQNTQSNLQIQINCVLHAGWIQQGFIGSSFKMDYCYFGHTVNQIKNIGYYCHKLPNSLFITKNVHDLISSGMKKHTQIVGNYPNSNNKQQIPLYIVHLNLQNISPSKHNGQSDENTDISSVTLKKLLNFQCVKDQQQIAKYKASSFINMKKELREVLRNRMSEQYRKKYLQAYEHYINGEMAQSKQILDQIYLYNKDDPLVLRLIHLIDSCKDGKQKIQISRDQEMEWLTW